MFKFWTLQNILAPSYQNFIVNLLKIDLVKNITLKSETSHTTLYKMLKNDGYLISNEEISQKTNDIFLFGLKYFCNVMLRIMKQQKEKSLISIFAEILKVYIENDISKAKYVLEEFSNEEIIFEYLVYCPNGNSCLQCYELILTSFKKIYDELKINRESESNSNDENKEFIYKFINTYVLFISRNINKIAIEFVNNIFLKIIKIDDIYIKYLKYKKLDRWIYSFYNEEEDDDDEEEAILNTILTETEFPKIISNHKILAEKTMMFNGTKIDDIKGIEKDSSSDFDHQLMNKLKDASGNLKLIKFLFDCFQNIE